MNPCACGYYPDMQKCHCTTRAVKQYLGKISQPLLDRIDVLCVETPKIEFKELVGEKKEESSATIRNRVMNTLAIQRERYKKENFYCNSQIPSGEIKKYCGLNMAQEKMMEKVYEDLNLTARSYHKILKVARTLADMEASECIEDGHLQEAICYRSIDKKFWERP